MKKIIATLFMAGLCHSAPAQVVLALLFGDKLNTGKVEFGLVVAPALTNITNLESKARDGLNLAVYFSIHPDKKFYLHVEGLGKGAFGAKDIKPYPTESDTLDKLFAGGSIERSIQSFGLPVLVRYRIAKLFFAEAGAQTNLRLKVKDRFETELYDNELEYTINVSDQFTRLDFGLAGGLFYRFRKDRNSMGLGVRYYHGLTDTFKPMDGVQANTSWQATITIPVGAGKNGKEKAK